MDEFRVRIHEEKLYSFFTDKDWDEVQIKVCKFLYQTWLYSNCVALGDRMSMASSIDLRLSFLDYQFVELIMGLVFVTGLLYFRRVERSFADVI